MREKRTRRRKRQQLYIELSRSACKVRDHRNRRAIWFMIAKTAREMIAWEAIGIAWILI